MNLNELLEDQAERILDDALCAVERAHLKRYEEWGREATRKCLHELYALAVESVTRRNLTALLEHVRKIGKERSRSGFRLREVQTAFNVLEESIWHHVLDELPSEQIAEALGLVSTALGAGKDQLARTFVEEASGRRGIEIDPKQLFSGKL